MGLHKDILRQYKLALIPFAGFLIGHIFDKIQEKRMTTFRDKSALYGRELKPGEPPSWSY